MQQQLVAMLELQNAMNQKVHPDWRTQNFAWYRAIWIECAELMDHYGWKWWKKQTPDRDQVTLELIDIWHFGLSALLEQGLDVEQLAKKVCSELQYLPTSSDFLLDVEVFAAQVIETREFDVAGFHKLMVGAELSFDELYKTYVGKNVLNIFRQENGYKTGEYIKIWSGREDNEHLVEVVNSINIASPSFKDEIYQGLTERYPS